MRLYNSATLDRQEFLIDDNLVRLYVCGITPYDTTHLGHAFTYATFDILIRFLEWQKVQVRYVQNVTDIDDDILRKAKQVGTDWRSLGNEWTRRFIDDMRALNIRPPDEYPRATDVMSDIVRMDSVLVERGAGYVSNGSMYFDVDAFPEFGQLSHLPRPEMLPLANERGNNPDDPNKRHPLDFVLWQRQAPGEPGWPSPWGEGRPGWHIECTTMVNRFLGPTIDIHGGGADLIFPHHECEIAQSVVATQHSPFSRYWMHIAMVRKDGEKMSKSLGNLVLVDDMLKQYSPNALRLYLASHHYRQPWEYEPEGVQQAAKMAERWEAAAGEAEAAGEPTLEGKASAATANIETVKRGFRNALDDDLNTPEAVAILDRFAQAILTRNYGGSDRVVAQEMLRELAGVLGLRLRVGMDERVIAGWNRHRRRFEE